MEDRTCNRCNRKLVGRQTKYCSHACSNRATTKARSNEVRSKGRPPCTVQGCDKLSRSFSPAKCPMHYHREYRTGTLDLAPQGPKWDDIRGRRYGTLLVRRRTGDGWECICDCGETRIARAGELNRTGQANTCGIPGRHLGDEAGYVAAHSRVRRIHGSASSHPCVDCGHRAYHWSYDHNDPDERTEIVRGQELPFSLKPEHYEARCVSCHKLFDLGRAHHQGA